MKPEYLPNPPGRTCTKCGHVKPMTDFYKKATGKYGRHSECKECTRRRTTSTYRSGDVKAHTARKAAWNAAHPERRRAAANKYVHKAVAVLLDGYVRHLLAAETGLRAAEIPTPLVSAKRTQIEITRFLKEQSA